jgi:hypothetical protein
MTTRQSARCEECRCGDSHEPIQITVQGRQLGREQLVALCQALERQLHCGHRFVTGPGRRHTPQ